MKSRTESSVASSAATRATLAAFYYWIVASALGIIVDMTLVAMSWVYLASPATDGVSAGDVASGVMMLILALVIAAVLALPVFMARWTRLAATMGDVEQLRKSLTSLTVTSAIYWVAALMLGLFVKGLFEAWWWALPGFVITVVGVAIVGWCWWTWRQLRFPKGQ